MATQTVTSRAPAALDAVVRGIELAKRYGEGPAAVDALGGVDVAFAPGTFTAIMGPSGSGKSTLMHLLAGLDRPTSGWVEIDGTRLDRARLGRHAGDGGHRVGQRPGDRDQGRPARDYRRRHGPDGLGCLLLSQVSVDGSYLGDIFFGLLVFGPGLGAAYVAGSIGSLAGVTEAEAGLASGLNNSSFQIGGAVGVAILSTVAVSRADGADPLAAFTNGSQAAFGTAIIFAALGLLAAVVLLGQLRAPAPAAEPTAASVD